MTPKKIALFAVLVLFLLLSCDLSSLAPAAAPTTDPAAAVALALAQTQQALTMVAFSVQQTVAAAGGGAPPAPPGALPTYTFQPTYTQYFTLTPSSVTVTVSTNTNCRTGPGDDYPIVGALVVGQVAEVVGRSASSDNWIVKLPGKTSTCWLWGFYATVVGSTASLPVFTPPATPTFTVSPFINITIVSTGGADIWYVYISDSDDPDWGSNELPGIIYPGTSYTWYNYVPDVYDVMIKDSGNFVLKTWMGISMYTNTTLYYP